MSTETKKWWEQRREEALAKMTKGQTGYSVIDTVVGKDDKKVVETIKVGGRTYIFTFELVYWKSTGKHTVGIGITRCNYLSEDEDRHLPFSAEDISQAITNMRRYGGGFMRAIADALEKADLGNEEKLMCAFGRDIERYLKMP